MERFNPRAREGRDCSPCAMAPGAWIGFNPRAREGRDSRRVRRQSRSEDVSIHAPARGATVPPVAFNSYNGAFQSTRPRGARRVFVLCHGFPCQVSIHAPARGATSGNRRCPQKGLCFNPRAREGRDTVIDTLHKICYKVSIHAPARGATIAEATRIATELVSIHAPARGATGNS